MTNKTLNTSIEDNQKMKYELNLTNKTLNTSIEDNQKMNDKLEKTIVKMNNIIQAISPLYWRNIFESFMEYLKFKFPQSKIIYKGDGLSNSIYSIINALYDTSRIKNKKEKLFYDQFKENLINKGCKLEKSLSYNISTLIQDFNNKIHNFSNYSFLNDSITHENKDVEIILSTMIPIIEKHAETIAEQIAQQNAIQP
jgi:hypothetical protein